MPKRIAVIGLGRFGKPLALELADRGAEVLAIDRDFDPVEDVKEHVAHAVRLDCTEPEPMRAQGLDDFDVVVVAMGENFEASLLTVTILQQLDVQRIVSRATTSIHERILHHLGVKEVILPAEEAAGRLANSLLLEGATESFAVSTDYTIIEAPAPKEMIGSTVGELDLPATRQISLVTIKREESRPRLLGIGKRTVERIVGIPTPETAIERGDVLIVFGRKPDIERIFKDEES